MARRARRGTRGPVGRRQARPPRAIRRSWRGVGGRHAGGARLHSHLPWPHPALVRARSVLAHRYSAHFYPLECSDGSPRPRAGGTRRRAMIDGSCGCGNASLRGEPAWPEPSEPMEASSPPVWLAVKATATVSTSQAMSLCGPPHRDVLRLPLSDGPDPEHVTDLPRPATLVRQDEDGEECARLDRPYRYFSNQPTRRV